MVSEPKEIPSYLVRLTDTTESSDAQEHRSLSHLKPQFANIHLLTLIIHATFLRYIFIPQEKYLQKPVLTCYLIRFLRNTFSALFFFF